MTLLKALRISNGYTQVQVAQRAGLSVRCYQRIEAGENQPRVYTARRIASVFNTTVEELFPDHEDAKTVNREVLTS